MALEPGDKLGPYEILSPLGAGGMGEVYRARDSKLGRDVAVKVLPEEFAKHPQRLARFEREARLLAALNHPRIATLYGVELTFRGSRTRFLPPPSLRWRAQQLAKVLLDRAASPRILR